MTNEPNKGFVRLRDTRHMAAAAGHYSHTVHVLKWLLPSMVLVVFASLLVWPFISEQNMISIVAENIPDLKVDNLRMTGVGSNSRPYKLTAKKALAVSSSNALVDLEKPAGEISLGPDTSVTGIADFGRYNEKEKRLWLGGDVQFFHDEGYQFLTTEAQVDLEQNNAWGSKPVVIEGAFGQIKGEGFRLLNGGKVVVVTGHSKAILNMKKTKQPREEKKK